MRDNTPDSLNNNLPILYWLDESTKPSIIPLFVVIESGYEGIKGLLYATSDPIEATNKVLQLRQSIYNARLRRKDALIKFPPNDNILTDEWEYAKYKEPDAYCVQKWDGNTFTCACDELHCNPSETWLM